jgi:hypothetical protein
MAEGKAIKSEGEGEYELHCNKVNSLTRSLNQGESCMQLGFYTAKGHINIARDGLNEMHHVPHDNRQVLGLQIVCEGQGQ